MGNLMHDFYADTKSIPTKPMLESILSAPLGDEQKGEDPTTARLEARVAELLGKEAAVFMISGTMCNEVAVRVHCNPGDEASAAYSDSGTTAATSNNAGRA